MGGAVGLVGGIPHRPLRVDGFGGGNSQAAVDGARAFGLSADPSRAGDGAGGR